MQLAPRVVADADTCSGHPRIQGTRVRVSHVLGWLAAGVTEAEIVDDYPYLTPDDIRAALNYAATLADAQTIAAE
jgi:uncharacterized protein (DUF433 family)